MQEQPPTGKEPVHGRRCVCTISPQRPQEAQHSCPLTSRIRSLPNPAAAESKSVRAVCDESHSALYYRSHALSVTTCARACTPKVSHHSTRPANRRITAIITISRPALPESPDSRFSTRHHGQCYRVDTAATVELREAFPHSQHTD